MILNKDSDLIEIMNRNLKTIYQLLQEVDQKVDLIASKLGGGFTVLDGTEGVEPLTNEEILKDIK